MVAHHAQSVGIPPPVALTMMIVGRWTWGRSAYRWTKSAATMALAIRAKSLSASVMRSRRQQPEYAPVKAACSSLSVTRDMSGFRSTRSVRFSPEGSHAAGGQNGPDHRCDWAASDEAVELRRGSGAVGHERAAFSPTARRL